MSEYQFVHFLAVDRPLDDKQLAYMERQSSRAEITKWEFTNEYHYGDFRGEAEEMLRRGFDLHLHYANFGIRKLMIRLPGGLPCDRRTFEAFCPEYGVAWIGDKKGKGGSLEISPQAEPDSYDEYMDDLGGLLPRLAPLREALIGGDLRALYLAWLVCNFEEDAPEPPVPAGLGKLTPALEAMAEFYEVDVDLLAAAAQQSPPLPQATERNTALDEWIAKQSKDDLARLVQQLLAEDAARSRAETLSRIRDASQTSMWPLAEPTRTLTQLREAAEAEGDERSKRERRADETKRRKRLAAISSNPAKVVASIKELVEERSIDSYERAAQELADLRDALGPDEGPARAREIVQKLRREKPRLHHLAAALRKQGLLD
jgi:hypothetical protein